ncbi:bifunctional glycosyltransferase/CDP-glycerol:glycerophosphate glycerophosphotransferase [Actinomadura rupiterrae]|uniref:bifunctional glycosyltransferase/CDP-glycerol:glycerophosphate glycerophosphotransferase n=1 Tax=Actinomadura rupiterrae TaxID=559627 RepID=UPI0020A4632D|nr:bifunctional glycosyltransferase family 2 protein/CDP-glycerol:glycerophosphate glycerophosphotransferase [Actinomadura rupiterrae]MCP2335548.1 CDP-glycerol glycerophosphotransferase [Actinomadura rupiterrae]
MAPKISIVVPFYNVEDYLEECLVSLARQTLSDIEVVMVDDGSPDNCAVIAKAFAEKDPRFRFVQQENQGLGPARNTGAAHATGEYLAFVDSDDVVARYAYELMTQSLDRTGSDMAVGNVRRFNGGRTWQCWAHQEPCERSVERTHVSRQHNLMQDRMVWNKVFRRSFWDARGLAFPGILYEDSPVMVAAHVLAKSVDVFAQPVYYWRDREGSITKRKAELSNLEDRMASVRMVHEFLDGHPPALKAAYDRYALDVDLGVLTENLQPATEAERARIMELGAACLRDAAPGARGLLPMRKRLRLHLLERGMLPELLEVLRFEKSGDRDAAAVRRGLFRHRWYLRYPFFEDAERAIPDEIYDVTDELKLWAAVDDLRWEDGKLRIDGHAYFSRIDAASPRDLKMKVWLQDPRGRRRIDLAHERVVRPDVTAASRQSAANHDHSGFTFLLDPERLKIGRRRAVNWELHVAVDAQGKRGERRVGPPRRPSVSWAHARTVSGRVKVQPAADPAGFMLQVKPERALVTGHRTTEDGALRLEGWTDTDLGKAPVVRVHRQHGQGMVERPVRDIVAADGGLRFAVELPLDELLPDPCAEDRVARATRIGDGVNWELRLRGAGEPVRLMFADGVREARYPVGAQDFVLTRTRFGNVRGVERFRRPVVTDVAWADGDRLVLTGEMSPGPVPDELIVRRRRSSEEHRVPLAWDGHRFRAELTPGRMPLFGSALPLRSGLWDLVVGSEAGETMVVMERAGIAGLPATRTVGMHEIAFSMHQVDALSLSVQQALADDERGQYAQRRIQEDEYPRMRERPLRDLAVFDSYEGVQYSCSPRAVFEELRRRRPDIECVWATRDGQFEVPEGARGVLMESRAHYEAMAQARWVVGNFGQLPWFVKRPGQTYMQTWHGTPLKRLAYDLRDMPYKRTETLDWMEREVPRWDVLISPNPFTTPIMRRAFRYDGEILETGYPRNDVLTAPGAEAVARRVRERLGVPDGKKVVLYAPTWRDDHHLAPGRRAFSLELDLALLRERLGDDHVVLVRAHYLITDRSWSDSDGFVIDVSRYGEIAELYLAADVLVTDYSSAMFDFAVTGKPMVFYAYDLEAYRDTVRGFYLDFDAEAPGPIVRTSAEVAEALADLGTACAPRAGAYAAFRAAYCPYDDGRAAARAVDRLLAGPTGK